MGRPSKKKPALNPAHHSLNPDRIPENGQRSRKTINRLLMYKNFKPKRDKKGKIIKEAIFQKKLPSGTVARIEPNRRWFENTRVITQDALQKFKTAVEKTDPFQVLVRRSKLPITLLDQREKVAKYDVGSKSSRKPQLTFDSILSFASDAKEKCEEFSGNGSSGNLFVDSTSHEPKNESASLCFRAGHNKRIWGELYKVLDSSDVVLYVLDARDPIGTRSPKIEDFLKKEKPHVQLIWILNKCDLVPNEVLKKWKIQLSKQYPTLAFRSSLLKPFGRKELFELLLQLGKLHNDRQQISVGVVGYPNVGKSSLINAMRGKVVCSVAPIAGQTKVWQYITLMKNIYMIDCPGVVTPDDTCQVNAVLKGVIRLEYVDNPFDYIPVLLQHVNVNAIMCRYKLEKMWTDADDLVEMISRKYGKLLKGGIPDINCVAKMILSDYQRGKLPHFEVPPISDQIK